MKAVLAGSYEQFRFWLRETNTSLKEAFYVSSEEVIRGRDFDELVLYGTYYRRSDYRRLQDACEYLIQRARGLK